MAPKPATTSVAETVPAETIDVQVIDRLDHDGASYGPGDAAAMSRDTARQLRALGVVAFDDPEPTTPAA